MEPKLIPQVTTATPGACQEQEESRERAEMHILEVARVEAKAGMPMAVAIMMAGREAMAMELVAEVPAEKALVVAAVVTAGQVGMMQAREAMQVMEGVQEQVAMEVPAEAMGPGWVVREGMEAKAMADSPVEVEVQVGGPKI